MLCLQGFSFLSLRGLSESLLESDFPVQTLPSSELGFTFPGSGYRAIFGWHLTGLIITVCLKGLSKIADEKSL